MANEIQQTVLLSCTNGDFNQPQLGTPQSINQSTPGGGAPGYLSVGVAEVDIDLSGFNTPGVLYIKNIGEYGTGTGPPVITYGPKSGGSLIEFGDLKEGEEASFRLTGEYTPTLTLISTELDTRVQLVILED